MRRGLVLAGAVLVFVTAAFFGMSGSWPGGRPSPATPDPGTAVPRAEIFTETVDTLDPGETLSDLFTRHNVGGIDFHRLDPALALNP
ncbi:MAG TPA: hypothetical protein VE420_02595, partial [Gemmatimonadales bacterium]|nr:hypothetical protein [Gemmatimonadales bacterium]